MDSLALLLTPESESADTRWRPKAARLFGYPTRTSAPSDAMMALPGGSQEAAGRREGPNGAAMAFVVVLGVVASVPTPADAAKPGFKDCASVAGVRDLEIGPKRRSCRVARAVARTWVRTTKCDPDGRASRNCALHLTRPWGCGATSFGSEPYYVRCTRNFWHPMSGDPITAMVTFDW